MQELFLISVPLDDNHSRITLVEQPYILHGIVIREEQIQALHSIATEIWEQVWWIIWLPHVEDEYLNGRCWFSVTLPKNNTQLDFSFLDSHTFPDNWDTNMKIQFISQEINRIIKWASWKKVFFRKFGTWQKYGSENL